MVCLQVLDEMVAKKHILFSTDSYHPQFKILCHAHAIRQADCIP